MHTNTKSHVTKGRGFTVVELLFVFAIISLLAGLSASTFIAVRQTEELKTASQDVWIALRSARSATLSSAGDQVYGVHIASNKIVRFSGATYGVNSTTDVVSTFPGSVLATSSLSSNATDIVFTRLSGEASATGTITLLQTTTNASKTISIAKTGLIDISP